MWYNSFKPLDHLLVHYRINNRNTVITSLNNAKQLLFVYKYVERLIFFDVYENNAYDIQQEQYLLDAYVVTLIGYVRNTSRLKSVFDEYKPDIVYHAVPYKHMPLMKVSPNESVKNNVLGTWNVVKIAAGGLRRARIRISSDVS